MPLTRGRKAEPRPSEMAASSGEEISGREERFSSAQEGGSSREDLTDLRRLELAQAHEYRLKQLELEKMERHAQREKEKMEREERLEREKIALDAQMEKEKMERQERLEREKIALEKGRMSFEL